MYGGEAGGGQFPSNNNYHHHGHHSHHHGGQQQHGTVGGGGHHQYNHQHPAPPPPRTIPLGNNMRTSTPGGGMPHHHGMPAVMIVGGGATVSGVGHHPPAAPDSSVPGTLVLPKPGTDAKPMMLPRRRGAHIVHTPREKLSGKRKPVKDPNTPKHLRRCAGKVWNDATLEEWPKDGYRFFVGDLGNECTDEILASAFKRFSSFQKAKIVTDRRNGKSRGYGFVQVGNADDALRCLKEMNRKYVGNRPITVIRSRWKDRDIDSAKNKQMQYLRAEMSEAAKATRKFKKIAKTANK